jgi:Leucine-rich repeat (LRR) protein
MTTFNISHNPLKGLPPQFPAQLKQLFIAYCGLTEVPDGVGSVQTLELLCACGNRLTKLPLVPNVRILCLSRNAFQQLSAIS